LSTTPPGRDPSEGGAPAPSRWRDPAERERLRKQQAELQQSVSAQVDRLQRNLDHAQRSMGALQAALESNRRIGIAVGILMTRLRITDDAAFELLRRASNDRNVKLRLVAEEVIYTGELDP
jgi:AmiR/NasT family two-component response regulator